jgi:hypothetical protein
MINKKPWPRNKGKRSKGRQRMRWSDGIKKIMEMMTQEITLHEVETLDFDPLTKTTRLECRNIRS